MTNGLYDGRGDVIDETADVPAVGGLYDNFLVITSSDVEHILTRD